jgi:6,7-dimethyl-8-ribityllumazine synthase
VKQAPRGRASGHGLRALVLHAEFNARVVGGLVAGARRVLLDAGVEALDEVAVPGAFELPAAASAAAASARYDLVVALGAVIRGETDHYEHVARAAAAGLSAVAREGRLALGFGVLTVAREEQALARSGPGPGNKGAEAARAALAMVPVLRALGAGRSG